MQILESLNVISGKIQGAARRAGRNPKEITLLAASKGMGLDKVKEAAACGLEVFGENRVQEGIAKFLDSGFVKKVKALHLIGPLQTNKVKKAVGFFDLIHSVDSLRLAEKIEQEAVRNAIRQSILIEVNISGEANKHGVSLKEARKLVPAVRKLTHLSLLGLMTIPPKVSDPEQTRSYFSSLRNLGHKLDLYQFSMGMSSDFEVAIEEGATWIRIGRGIFGETS